MKFQIMLSYALLASLLMGCCLADGTSISEKPTSEKMSTTTPTYSTLSQSSSASVSSESSSESVSSEPNMTMPIIIIVEEEDNSMRTQYDTDSDYSSRDINWVVVKKITNITLIKESSVDPETKKTKDVVIENKAEEYRMFHDDRQRRVLTEKDIQSMPFPMRFLYT